MLKIIRNIKTSEFYRNVLTLISGTAIAQSIPILISPILTRIYSPSDFGIIALYLAIVNIFVIFASGRYNLAIMLPETEKEASDLKYLSIYLSIIVSLLLLITIALFNKHITIALDSPQISIWLYLIPFSVFLRSVYQAYEYYENRKKNYKHISYSNVSQTVITALTRLGMGAFSLGSIGIVLSSFFGALTGAVHLKHLSSKKDRKYKKPSIRSLKISAKRYIKFPLYTMPSNGLNVISIQIPVILLTRFFSSQVVGFYSFSHRMLSMPMAVIGRSVGQVYFQKASTIRKNKKELAHFTYSIYKKLLIIGIIPMSIIGIWGDYIFQFIFGEEWVIAGIYSQFLSIWFLFNFISSPLSQLFSILEKQQKSLIVNSILLLFRATPLIIGGMIYVDNALNVIILYSFISTFFWIGFCLYLLNLVKIPIFKVVIYTTKIIAAFLIPLLIIRLIFLQLPFQI